MGKLNEAQFKAQIKEGNFSNVYFIYGTENYLKDFYLGKLKKKLVNDAFADFNFRQYEGQEAEIDDIILDSQLMPMMSEYTLIIVHDFPLVKKSKDKLVQNKESMDKLKEYFKDISETCIMVFWYEGIEVTLKKDSPWNSVINAFSKAGEVVELNERTPAELNKLLVNYAAKRNCTLDRNTASYLIECVGANIQLLFNELEKLCLYSKDGVITRESVDKTAVKTLQAKVFDLSGYILRGDSENAFKGLFALLYQKEDAGGILSVIASYYIDMYRVKCAKEAGKTPADVANYYFYPPNRTWVLNKAGNDSSKISINNLREALDILSDADMRMKSTGISQSIILEEAVSKLLILRGKYE